VTTAPEWGDAANPERKRGPRRQPGNPTIKSIDASGHNADHRPGQGPYTLRVRRDADTIRMGNVITHDTTNPDKVQLRLAAQAIALQVLAQMKRYLRFLGLETPRPEDQEAWLDVAIAQYVLLEIGRPRRTWGVMKWAQRYTPHVYTTRSAAWIDERVQLHRRHHLYYKQPVIGCMLKVTREAFFAAELWHMWPAGCSLEDRKRLSLDRRAELAKVAYHKTRPDAVLRERSLSQTKPWEQHGISRRTYERRRKSGLIQG